MKKTTFNVTSSALELENVLLKKMDIPRTNFHRRMIDYYLKYDREVNPYLLIRKRSDPNYVKKDLVEQIYLDEDREKALMEIAERYSSEGAKCGTNTVLFQALLSYCVAQAPLVLGEETVNKEL